MKVILVYVVGFALIHLFPEMALKALLELILLTGFIGCIAVLVYLTYAIINASE